MNRYLAIDTSSSYLTVLVCGGGEPVCIFEKDGALQHSVRLMDAVDEAFSRAGMRPQDCDFFCAVTGPGSFTGIRIGVSAVKGFCEGTGKPALGRTSFRVLAYNAEGKVLAVVPAGRGNYYVCGFDGEKRVSLAPAYVGEEKLKDLSALYTVVSYEALPVPYVQADPAAGLLCAVRAAREEDLGDLAAFYLKKSQAEEERERREG